MNKYDIFERFTYFQDSLLRSVSIKYAEDGRKNGEVVIYTRDYIDGAEVWGTVTILVANVSSYRFQEAVNTTAVVISTGAHLVDFDGKEGVELGDILDAPESLEELFFSDLFILGDRVEMILSEEFC